jgi:hypothetical protein
MLISKLMTQEYTIEQLELDFENAPSFDKKVQVLSNAIDKFDASGKEVISRLKNELSDIKELMDIEQDIQCKKDIESGKLDLYKCFSELEGYNVGESYYVKIDDVQSIYSTNQVTELSDEVKEYISNIKPIIWIYKDNGIGTPKYKTVFTGDFNKYFSK